jgi:hypothetical protein
MEKERKRERVEMMKDPEVEARKFRMMALLIFVLFLMFVYFLFDYVAKSKDKDISGMPGGGKRRSDF